MQNSWALFPPVQRTQGCVPRSRPAHALRPTSTFVAHETVAVPKSYLLGCSLKIVVEPRGFDCAIFYRKYAGKQKGNSSKFFRRCIPPQNSSLCWPLSLEIPPDNDTPAPVLVTTNTGPRVLPSTRGDHLSFSAHFKSCGNQLGC